MIKDNPQDQALASSVEVAITENGNFELFWEKRNVWLTVGVNEWQNAVFTLYTYPIEEEFENEQGGVDIKKFFKAIDVTQIKFVSSDKTTVANLDSFPDTIELVKSLVTHKTVVDVYNEYMQLVGSVHNVGVKQ